MAIRNTARSLAQSLVDQELTSLQSQAIQAGGQLYISGQIPADATGNLIEGSIADKTKACCEALKNILEDAGSGIDRVVKVCMHCSFDHRARHS